MNTYILKLKEELFSLENSCKLMNDIYIASIFILNTNIVDKYFGIYIYLQRISFNIFI